MNKQNHSRLKRVSKLGAVFGGLLLGVAALPTESTAQEYQATYPNPCPGIFYEEPYNRTIQSPANCPPNLATQLGIGRQPRELATGPTPGQFPPPPPQEVPQPPLPEERSQAVARVEPVNGTVNVLLSNDTNAVVTYEVTGQTGRRYLSGGEEARLLNLTLPVTITAVRQDEGLLELIPVEAQEGMLEFSIEEDVGLDDTQGVVRIQEDGQVFLN